MPLYWFHLDVPAQPPVIEERLRTLVRAKPGVREQLRRAWTSQKPSGPPFVGEVQEHSFTLRRDDSYFSRGFRPRIRGRILTAQTGTRVDVFMFIRPVDTILAAIWLGAIGYGALRDASASPAILWGIFAFGVALTEGSFFLEALKAKRLLSAAILKPN